MVPETLPLIAEILEPCRRNPWHLPRKTGITGVRKARPEALLFSVGVSEQRPKGPVQGDVAGYVNACVPCSFICGACAGQYPCKPQDATSDIANRCKLPAMW